MPFADAIADAQGVLATPLPSQPEMIAPPPSAFSSAIQDAQAALAEPPQVQAETKKAEPQKRSLRAMIEPRISAMKGEAPPSEPSEAATQAANVGAGATSSIFAGLPGLPGDIANLPFRAFGYKPPFAGTEFFNRQIGRLGIGTASIPPEARRETAQEVGQGIGAMAGPNVLAKGRAISGILGPATRGVEEALAAGSIPANVGIGAASGAGAAAGQGVLEGTGYEPLGYMAGSLAGGVGGALGIAAAQGAGRGIRGVYNAIPPLRASAQEAAANEAAIARLRGAASDPYASFETMETAPREMIPGAPRTTAEVSGDLGIASAQRLRQAETNLQDPASLAGQVQELRAQRAGAQIGALEREAPAGASIEDTQAVIRRMLADNDTQHAADIAAQRQSVDQGMPRARLAPEEAGAAARSAVEATRAPAGTALELGRVGAEESLANRMSAVGGERTAPEIGAAMRDPVAAAYAAETARLKALRNAIDPTGTMGMQPTAIKGAVRDIDRMFPAEGGAQLSGVERSLYDTVMSWGNLIPIDRAFQLRANINGRLAGLRGSDPQEALRLVELKRGVDQALENAAADIQAGEQSGVIHQGTPGIGERLGGYGGIASEIGPSFAQDVARAYAGNPTALRAAGRDETGRGILEAAGSANEPIPTGGLAGTGGGGSQGRGGPRGGAGGEGIPPEPLTPLTPEARERFADWNAGYREMGRTFRGETPGTLHAVGKMLQKGGAYDSYRLTDAEVPWLFVNKGKTAPAAVERFLNAAPAEAHAALDDAMAFSLRRAAGEGGGLDLAKYQRWLSDHGPILAQRPESRERFANAAAAQRTLNEVNEALAQHAREHPLRPGWGDAAILPRYFKPGAQGAETMREYGRITGGRAEALVAVEDYAAYSFANAAVRNGEIVPRLADAWLRQHSEALSAMPRLQERFRNVTTAQETLERAIAAHEAARSDFGRSVAGAMLGDDPERAIARVFSGSNRNQKADLLMQITQGSPAAREGLQRAAIDHIRQMFEGPRVTGTEVGQLAPERFRKFLDANREVISRLFPGRFANFEAIAKDLESALAVDRATVSRVGSHTAELTAGRGAHEHGDLGTAATVIIGEHMGEAARHLAGAHEGLIGHLISPIAAVGSAVGQLLLKSKQRQLGMKTDQLFDRMLLSPDFAAEMNRRYPVAAKRERASIGDALRGRVVQQAIASARSGLAN